MSLNPPLPISLHHLVALHTSCCLAIGTHQRICVPSGRDVHRGSCARTRGDAQSVRNPMVRGAARAWKVLFLFFTTGERVCRNWTARRVADRGGSLQHRGALQGAERARARPFCPPTCAHLSSPCTPGRGWTSAVQDSAFNSEPAGWRTGWI